jgi:flagellar basal body-associated protein FliL
MSILDTAKESFQSLMEKNSKLTITIIVMMVFLFVSAFVIVFIQASKAPQKRKPVKVPPAGTFTAVEELLPPDSLTLTEDYYFSRTHSRTWSEDETERYFTQPEEESLKVLSQANDKLIKRLEEAAP